MTPKEKITKEEIIDVAFQLLRKEGYKSISARAIANNLNLSTMPIYSQIGNMYELDKSLVIKVDEELVSYQKEKYSENALLNMSIGYVLFAQEERHLYKFMTQEKSRIQESNMDQTYFENSAANDINQLHTDSSDNIVADNFPGMSKESVGEIAKNSWIYTHGLASLLHSGLLPPMSIKEIEKFLHDGGTAFFLLENMKSSM